MASVRRASGGTPDLCSVMDVQDRLAAYEEIVILDASPSKERHAAYIPTAQHVDISEVLYMTTM